LVVAAVVAQRQDITFPPKSLQEQRDEDKRNRN